MSEIRKTYYHFALERYIRDGENMIIWSIHINRDTRIPIHIKDLDDIKIKNHIKKENDLYPVGKARIEILSNVLIKRRKQKIEKICSKLEIK